MPGMKEMTLELPQTNIKKINSGIPTPLGPFVVKWNRTNAREKLLQLEVPEGMVVRLDLNSLEIPAGKSLQINGKKIPQEATKKSFYSLSSGKWELIF